MKGPSDLLESLYELDWSYVNVGLITKALAQFLIGILTIYLTQYVYENFQVYFLYVFIPLVISIGYAFYSGFNSIRSAFRKGDKEYIVYVEDSQLKRREIT
jgi:hypothetical protein